MTGNDPLQKVMENLFCDEGRKALVAHLESCETCKRGLRMTMESFPVIKMVLPKDKLSELETLLKAKGG